MDSKIIIAVSPADLDAVMDFQKNFEGKAVNLEIIELPYATQITSDIEDEANCLLWLTPRTEDVVYDLSKRRRDKGLTSLNIIPERFQFTPEQRGNIGRNAAIYLSLLRGDVVEEVLKRLGRGLNKNQNVYRPENEHQENPVSSLVENSDQYTSASDVLNIENNNAVFENTTGQSQETEDDFDSSGYQFTAIITFYVVLYTDYWIFGDFRSDTIIFHIMNFLEGAAALFCFLMALMGFLSKKWWPILKSILCVLVGIYGISVFWKGFTHIGDLF